MKYIRENAVKSTSNVKIVRLCSTAMKYPLVSMSLNTRICKNVAPPRQLSPNTWKSTCARRSCFAGVDIAIVNSKS